MAFIKTQDRAHANRIYQRFVSDRLQDAARQDLQQDLQHLKKVTTWLMAGAVVSGVVSLASIVISIVSLWK